ncbi:MAG TPA: hypothetical protein VL426_01305 [Candidatus Binatia bacterium]|nr:hypothetical protein [Candidatus Binatia bacterium]
MDHNEVSALIRDCISSDRSARDARERADGLLGSFLQEAKAGVDAAIAAFNAGGRGTYLYDSHETKVSIVRDQGTQKVCVTISLGAFRLRDSGLTLMPREAWPLDEEQLIGELRNHLGNHLLWLQHCHLGIHPPLDYDIFTADPEL